MTSPILSSRQTSAVSALIKHVAETCILPRFRALKDGDVSYKHSPLDPVSVADKEAEAVLQAGLFELLPGSDFLGEELAAAQPDTLQRLSTSQQPLWVVDPIDGTYNFVTGKPGFGVMICLVLRGETVSSWLYDILAGRLYERHTPQDVHLNGETLPIPAPGHAALKGLIGRKLMVLPALKEALGQLAEVEIDETNDPSVKAYPRLLTGDLDFLVYKVTYPWDHLPGIHLLSRTKAVYRRWDGSDFQITDTHKGLIVARDEAVMDIALKRIIAPILAGNVDTEIG